jgi:hypothetical protein
MPQFTGTVKFGSNIGSIEAQEWLDAIADQLPEGVQITLKQEPLVLDVADLTDAHKGEQVKVWVPGYGEVTGRLDAVFSTGRKTDESTRTLIIDGRAWTLTFGVVTLSEW